MSWRVAYLLTVRTTFAKQSADWVLVLPEAPVGKGGILVRTKLINSNITVLRNLTRPIVGTLSLGSFKWYYIIQSLSINDRVISPTCEEISQFSLKTLFSVSS